MDFGQKNRAPIVTHEVPDLAELVSLIHTGHAAAAQQLHRILSTGVRFLLQRRLGRIDVDREAESVLETAIRTIQNDISVRADGVPQMVRRLIQQQCPGQTKSAIETGATGGPWQEVVEGILDGMSPVEREALRRCYVLGEAPETFLDTLRLTLREFHAIRVRARAEFSSRKAKTNVA
jgi:hypothetical protein